MPCTCLSCDIYRISPYKRPSRRKYSPKSAKDAHRQRLQSTDKTGFAAIRAVQREYNRRNLYESSG